MWRGAPSLDVFPRADTEGLGLDALRKAVYLASILRRADWKKLRSFRESEGCGG